MSEPALTPTNHPFADPAGNENYARLRQRAVEANLLSSCASLLAWEQETYMPAGGVEHRSRQLTLLAGLVHQRRTDPHFGELLAKVESVLSTEGFDADTPEAANVREWRHDYDRVVKLPQALIEELAGITVLAQPEWALARKTSDFARFEPWLEKIVILKRQQAEALGYAEHPYDALLDEYETGATKAALTDVFAALRQELVPLVQVISLASRQPRTEILHREYPVDKQQLLGEMAAAAIGFDFQRGRLDVTTHPFCQDIGPGDCRITTRYNPRSFNEGFFGILHEAGHALYEQGLLPEHYGTPMGQSVSLGMHESQSRVWENTVGRGSAFWEYFYPLVQRTHRAALHDVSRDDFLTAANAVTPSLIRVEADEATYDLHVLVRFELEALLLTGELPVADLPHAWNEKYRQYLGVTVPDDRQGVLQDVHWSAGLFGYFPTYTLGNLYRGQLYAAACQQLGDLEASFRRGDFQPLLEWLRQNVHHHGRRYRPARLLERITGEKPSHQAFVQQLRQKLTPLYGLTADPGKPADPAEPITCA